MGQDKRAFSCADKTVTLYPACQEGAPLVVLNTYAGDGEPVVAQMRAIDTPACSLLVVGDLAWDHDMAPWDCPPLRTGDAPSTGGASDYLALLLDEILPQTMERLGVPPAYAGIAGYSLAGLFATWAPYHCDAFARVASMSGSLWFPDFLAYAQRHEMRRVPERMYLSLGDHEARTRNPYLRHVQENTEALAAYWQAQGSAVTYELNPGNHFKNAALRTAKGIKAILA